MNETVETNEPCHLDLRVAVIGLGYVGLPLAAAFAKTRLTLGFDIDTSRIASLNQSVDSTGELSKSDLASLDQLQFTSDPEDLASADCFIITVPTPVDAAKNPDLRPLESATRTVGHHLKKDSIVIYESTVYPGCTEEICVPILEKVSGLKLNKHFAVGYSPERINPGDSERKLEAIVKVTSGSNERAAQIIDELYRSIICAGTHRASSIKVAEAAKVIENTQRDINIALMNELAVIFSKLNIDTSSVLAAAKTKWNFLPFTPGLVGGHCIGVDPYYLTYKARAMGYHPQIIDSGRRLNDSMAGFFGDRIVQRMADSKIAAVGSRILVLGVTFKENCPDVRNTQVVDLIRTLEKYGATIDVMDPVADPHALASIYGIELAEEPNKEGYDAVVLAVPHEALIPNARSLFTEETSRRIVRVDLKSVFPPELSDLRL